MMWNPCLRIPTAVISGYGSVKHSWEGDLAIRKLRVELHSGLWLTGVVDGCG